MQQAHVKIHRKIKRALHLVMSKRQSTRIAKATLEKYFFVGEFFLTIEKNGYWNRLHYLRKKKTWEFK